MNEAITLSADTPEWYVAAYLALVAIIGHCRIPMKIGSAMVREIITERIAVMVLRKEDTSTVLDKLASPWYIYSSKVLDTIFSIKLPTYEEVLEIINQKKALNESNAKSTPPSV